MIGRHSLPVVATGSKGRTCPGCKGTIAAQETVVLEYESGGRTWHEACAKSSQRSRYSTEKKAPDGMWACPICSKPIIKGELIRLGPGRPNDGISAHAHSYCVTKLDFAEYGMVEVQTEAVSLPDDWRSPSEAAT